MTELPERGNQRGAPLRLRIGVTGHRRLKDEAELARCVGQVVERVQGLAPGRPLALTVVSPIAEGADRLVAREILSVKGSELETPLPLPPKEYMNDFESEESKSEFLWFLSEAKEVEELPPAESREGSYESVGRHVVDNCDALIALWDGQESRGRGGTAEIVRHARDRGLPLFWICTERPHGLVEERIEQLRQRVSSSAR